jgi:hypothetical protein
MAFSSGAQRDLHYIEETVFGELPDPANMTEMRNTEDSISLSRDNFVSDERRGDRGIHDMRLGNKQPGGDINFEFSYGSFDDFLMAALGDSEWHTDGGSDYIKKGTTVTSFSIEKAFSDISQYQLFKGGVVNGFSLDINPNAMVTGSFSMLFKDFENAGTAFNDAVADVNANRPFDGFTGTIEEGGSSNAEISSFSMSLDNGFERNFVLMANTAPQMTSGKSNVTGSVTYYFADSDVYDKFVGETESSVTITLQDDDGNTYAIYLPRIKYTSADTPVNSDGAIIITMNYQALDDATEETNIKITRTDA